MSNDVTIIVLLICRHKAEIKFFLNKILDAPSVDINKKLLNPVFDDFPSHSLTELLLNE